MERHSGLHRNDRAWPPRPVGEAWPPVLNTVDVAMLLRYDAREGVDTPEKGARMVRLLVRDRGLPTLRKVGRGLLYSRDAVLAWLADGADAKPERLADMTADADAA